MDQRKIGTFIAKCRKDKNLTQAQLAESVGVSDKAVSKWENGKSLPDASIMASVCEALEISITELFNGERISSADYERTAGEKLLEMKQEGESSVFAKIMFTIFVCLTVATVILLIVWLNAAFKFSRSVEQNIDQIYYGAKLNIIALRNILMGMIK